MAEIIVSSCLVGKKCAYDGRSRLSQPVLQLCKSFNCVDLCPEISGGLGCPRDCHEIVDGAGGDVLDGNARVLTSEGKDHTSQFINGAGMMLECAVQNSVKLAIMKARSPSCGKGMIYSGKFDHTLRKGNGVTTALFLSQSIKVFTEEEIPQACSALRRFQL